MRSARPPPYADSVPLPPAGGDPPGGGDERSILAGWAATSPERRLRFGLVLVGAMLVGAMVVGVAGCRAASCTLSCGASCALSSGWRRSADRRERQGDCQAYHRRTGRGARVDPVLMTCSAGSSRAFGRITFNNSTSGSWNPASRRRTFGAISPWLSEADLEIDPGTRRAAGRYPPTERPSCSGPQASVQWTRRNLPICTRRRAAARRSIRSWLT